MLEHPLSDVGFEACVLQFAPLALCAIIFRIEQPEELFFVIPEFILEISERAVGILVCSPSCACF